MAKACPRNRPGSRGASLGNRRPADRAEVPEAQAFSKASTRLFFRRSVLARVFAPDGGQHSMVTRPCGEHGHWRQLAL